MAGKYQSRRWAIMRSSGRRRSGVFFQWRSMSSSTSMSSKGPFPAPAAACLPDRPWAAKAQRGPAAHCLGDVVQIFPGGAHIQKQGVCLGNIAKTGFNILVVEVHVVANSGPGQILLASLWNSSRASKVCTQPVGPENQDKARVRPRNRNQLL